MLLCLERNARICDIARCSSNVIYVLRTCCVIMCDVMSRYMFIVTCGGHFSRIFVDFTLPNRTCIMFVIKCVTKKFNCGIFFLIMIKNEKDAKYVINLKDKVML